MAVVGLKVTSLTWPLLHEEAVGSCYLLVGLQLVPASLHSQEVAGRSELP